MLILEEKTKKPIWNKKIVLIIWGTSIVILILLIIDFIPLYNSIRLNPPEGEFTTGKWDKFIYSSYLLGDNQLFPALRVYIQRKEVDISFSSVNNNNQWNEIADYFRAFLNKNGWKEMGYPGNCIYYFPEANYTEYGENGFISFMKGPYDENQSNLNHLACLGIHKIKGDKSSYHIVFETVELSVFSRLVQLID